MECPTFMKHALAITLTAILANHWLGVGKNCTTTTYVSLYWMWFGFLQNMIQYHGSTQTMSGLCIAIQTKSKQILWMEV